MLREANLACVKIKGQHAVLLFLALKSANKDALRLTVKDGNIVPWCTAKLLLEYPIKGSHRCKSALHGAISMGVFPFLHKKQRISESKNVYILVQTDAKPILKIAGKVAWTVAECVG